MGTEGLLVRMSIPDRQSSEVHDFREILSHEVDGELPLLVGGHAVNLWAFVYREKIGSSLEQWLPLTSKDLDLVGTNALLESLKKHFGGEYRLSGPRGPVVGRLVVHLEGETREIDVLREVFGMRRQELEKDSVILHLGTEGESNAVRVLPILPLLKAKTANLSSLDQSARNDFKHVRLMLLVAKEYLAELVLSAEEGTLGSRATVIALEESREIVLSRQAIKCATDHGVDFASIWPRQLLEAAKDPRIMNFVKHRLPS
jgi:hypothetical protein